MSSETLSRVQALTDDRVAPVLDDVFNTVFKQVPYAAVLASAEATPELAALTQLTADERRMRLPGSEVTEVGRELLIAMAEAPALEGFIADSLDRVEASHEMFISTLLVASALINLTYLVMATDVEVSQDAQGNRTWSAKKAASPPEFITKIVGHIVGLIPKTG